MSDLFAIADIVVAGILLAVLWAVTQAPRK